MSSVSIQGLLNSIDDIIRCKGCRSAVGANKLYYLSEMNKKAKEFCRKNPFGPIISVTLKSNFDIYKVKIIKSFELVKLTHR